MLMDSMAAVLRALPAETAHRSTIRLLGLAGELLPGRGPDDPVLATTILGRRFPNPIGLAAGFDKDAEVPDAMLRLGFGFVECGTITPLPQAGNPRPRLFRLARDGGVINRMGFNNKGLEAAVRQLTRRKATGILGLNIGANKDSADRLVDYRIAFAKLAPFADYVAVNVSSPNTPGLRSLQNRDALERLLSALSEERARSDRKTSLLLKIAPDMATPALDDLADVATRFGLDGIIATNTTVERPASLTDPQASETGGLSGKPLFDRATEVLRQLRIRLGNSLVLIGVGGVSSGADAYEKIRAGASLVQLYTALALQGPGLIGRIKRDLSLLLKRNGYTCVGEAVGTGLDNRESRAP